MPKKLWKVTAELKLRYPGTKIFQLATPDEIVEERVESGKADTTADVRVYRLHKEGNDFQSFMVSRSELEGNATLVPDSD